MQPDPAVHWLRGAAVRVAGQSIGVALVAYAFIGFGGFWTFSQFVRDPVQQETFAMVWWLPAGYCAWWAKCAAEGAALRLTRGPDDDARSERSMTGPDVPLTMPASPSKRYRVYAYDVSEEPAGEPPTQVAGEFDDAAEALACARWVVERDMSAADSDGTAEGIYRHYQYYGEGAMILGEPRVEFHCYEHARQHAEVIARRLSAPKGQAD